MLSVCTRTDCGSSGATRAAASSMTASTPSVYARLVGSVLRAISSSRAADGQPSSGLSRCRIERYSQELLGSGRSGRRRAQVLALFAELVGDRGNDQSVLGVEVGVERAVG